MCLCVCVIVDKVALASRDALGLPKETLLGGAESLCCNAARGAHHDAWPVYVCVCVCSQDVR